MTRIEAEEILLEIKNNIDNFMVLPVSMGEDNFYGLVYSNFKPEDGFINCVIVAKILSDEERLDCTVLGAKAESCSE